MRPELCDGKKVYDSEKEVRGVRKWVGERRDKDMRIYKCPRCFGWHITSLKGGAKFRYDQ